MIKNEVQAARTEARLRDVQAEIRELEQIYGGQELDFWAGSLKSEVTKLEAELNEYKQLKELSFEEAIKGPLQEPVLLENIGELLARLRIASKLTQEQMAEKVGWQQPNLSRFENENYNSQTVAKISEYAGSLGVWLYVTPALSERLPRVIYKAGQQGLRSPGMREAASSILSEQSDFASTSATRSIFDCFVNSYLRSDIDRTELPVSSLILGELETVNA